MGWFSRFSNHCTTMVGGCRSSFPELVLRPVACIINGCRPPRRKDKLGSERTKDTHFSTKVETAYPISDLQKHPDTESYPLKTKERLFWGFELQALDQPQCALLSDLPAEIRVMIYAYVLCVPVPVVHIVRRKDGSLCHVRCRASKGECGTYRCYNEYSELSRSTRGGSRPIESDSGSGELLSLPLSCKKMSVIFSPHCRIDSFDISTATLKLSISFMVETLLASSIFPS